MYERGWNAAANGESAFACPSDDDGGWVNGWVDYWLNVVKQMRDKDNSR